MSAPSMPAPEMSAPNMSALNMSAPEMSALDMFAPNMFASNMYAPNMSAPEMSAPEMSASEMSASELSAPEMSAPNMSVPETPAPNISSAVTPLQDSSQLLRKYLNDIELYILIAIFFNLLFMQSFISFIDSTVLNTINITLNNITKQPFHKIKDMGIIGKLGKWFYHSLVNRTQFVRLLSGSSTDSNVISGVPQGTVFGPLLFFNV